MAIWSLVKRVLNDFADQGQPPRFQIFEAGDHSNRHIIFLLLQNIRVGWDYAVIKEVLLYYAQKGQSWVFSPHKRWLHFRILLYVPLASCAGSDKYFSNISIWSCTWVPTAHCSVRTNSFLHPPHMNLHTWTLSSIFVPFASVILLILYRVHNKILKYCSVRRLNRLKIT